MHKFNQTYALNDSRGKKIPHIHFENLNALRFFAALSVFIFHFMREILHIYPALENNKLYNSFAVITNKGLLGVNFFFVLSGFLITYLILHEIKYTHKFSLHKFLMRRTLRIWPLYLLVGAIGFFIFPAVIDGYFTEHKAINYFLFLANFDEIWHGSTDAINFLTSPWSVAVEEQFYLFWGISIFILYRFKSIRIEYISGTLFLLSILFVWNNLGDERLLYYHTFAVAQDVLLGSFVGVLLFNKNKWLDKLQNIPKSLVILIYLTGFALCVAKNKLFVGHLFVLERPLLSLFFAFIILDQIRGTHSLLKVGKFKLLNYFGKISYGLYMYHLIVFYLLTKYISFDTINLSVGIVLYFVLAALSVLLFSSLSYRYIESKFLNLKPKR